MTEQLILSKLHQMPLSVQQEALDFIDFLVLKYQKQQTPVKVRKAGTMKNLVAYMAPDFDAPLEDFKEYM
jgi:hypothetical protein